MEKKSVELVFLGTGAAWGLPELNCPCLICTEMRKRGERRTRTSLFIRGPSNLLIDCGPDILSQMEKHGINKLDAVLITHEHGDHYIGLDELFVFKRTRPRGQFDPIAVYMTSASWNVIKQRFDYLEDMGVIRVHHVRPGHWLEIGCYEILPFKTNHGGFAKGSVGYLIRYRTENQHASLLYTSDFIEIQEFYASLVHPDYLIIQSFWLNEPVQNRPHHMSFQRAIEYIKRISPNKRTFLVHMGDADKVPGDPSNNMLKKYDPKKPLCPPGSRKPYAIPLNQSQWQKTVDLIMAHRGIPHAVTVAYDGLKVPLL